MMFTDAESKDPELAVFTPTTGLGFVTHCFDSMGVEGSTGDIPTG